MAARPMSSFCPKTPTWLTFEFPADPDRPPLSDVRLRFAQTVPYREWAQRLDGVPVSLLVRSAGQETGDFGHIYVDGVERSLNRRGYNLVAVSPDGRVLDSANFRHPRRSRGEHPVGAVGRGAARWALEWLARRATRRR